MNMLTISSISGGASHLIPLFVLHQRYLKKIPDLQNYFLLPKNRHDSFTNAGIMVLPIDYNLTVQSLHEDMRGHAETLKQMELRAFQESRPSFILEDNSFSTPLIAEKNDIPRISIHRTGFFRTIPHKLRNPGHMHSLEKGYSEQKAFDASFLLNGASSNPPTKGKQTETELLRNYLHAKTKLIPGIPSIEVLPKDVRNRTSYFYTGPLTVADNPSSRLKDELTDFLDLHKNKRKVFITLGLVDRSNISPYINYLLNKDYAVISTSSIVAEPTSDTNYFFNRFLPLNFISSEVDLIIHQCGAGMYHYPLLHGKPAITIGTQCYDREDVALRLQLLKASRHVPHPKDDLRAMEIFKQHIERFEKSELCDTPSLERLKEEIYQTMLNFDMEKVINFTLDQESAKKKVLAS